MVKEHIAREEQLRSMSVADYVTERQAMVQGQIRRLGISLSRTHPDHARFMAACLQAELGYLDVFHLRESRRGGCDQLHPDTVDGPWRRAKPAKRSYQAVDQPSSVAGAPSAAIIPAGKTLGDCRAKWIGNRAMARKSVRPAYLREMEHTIAAFQSHSGLIDIGAIRPQARPGLPRPHFLDRQLQGADGQQEGWLHLLVARYCAECRLDRDAARAHIDQAGC